MKAAGSNKKELVLIRNLCQMIDHVSFEQKLHGQK